MKSFSVILALVILSLPVHILGQPSKQQAKPKAPNIIFILTDDLGYGDLGVLFQNQRKKANDRSAPWASTPNIDHLAAMGAQLPHHYCAAPVCAPARASLLLGKHQGHANVRNNQFDKALDNNHTIASVLRAAGYATATFGKWGLQGTGNGPDWPAHPLNRGFDYYMGMIRHADGHEHYPKEGVYRGAKQVWENQTNIADKLDKCYTADLWTAGTKKWIVDFEKENSSKKPFFIYLAYETPHAVLELPTQAYPAGGGLKGGIQWLGEAGHMINTASGKVDSYFHPDYGNATYDHDKDKSTAEVPWPDVYKRYATSVRRIDDGVGDLLQLLQDLHIDDNTLIIFSSDNGPSIESYLKEDYAPTFFKSFGPFDGIKRDVWEGGIRVPTLAVWPGHIPANRTVQTPSGVHDWLPTVADAAGVPAPANADGVSLMPSLTGVGKQRSSTIYIEYFHNQSTPGFQEFSPHHRGRKRNQMQMIRFGDTLGVRYDVKSGKDNFEIYNVAKDPQEIKNLANEPGMEVVQNKMKERVLQIRMPDTSAPRPYDKDFVAAVKNLKTEAGIRWLTYYGNYPWLPDVATLAPSETGVAPQPAAGVSRRSDNGALLFNGYLQIPAEGEYTFTIKADAGAVLRIHDATVIDADFGYVALSEKTGTIRLQAGLHPFRLFYSLKKGNTPLFNLEWAAAGINKQKIPGEALFR